MLVKIILMRRDGLPPHEAKPLMQRVGNPKPPGGGLMQKDIGPPQAARILTQRDASVRLRRSHLMQKGILPLRLK